MRLLSYGEDALTLAALTGGIPSFLDQVRDSTKASDAVVFYRPSFGRRSGRAGRSRSEFGEFDAIVGTREGVYLVEAKWVASSELKDGALELREEQVRRHRAMRRYIEDWRRLQPESWAEFAAVARNGIEEALPGLTVPSAGTTLASNLEFVLRQLAPLGPVFDVLLMSAPEERAPSVNQLPDGFRLALFLAPSVGGAGYIDLGEQIVHPGLAISEARR